MSARLLVEGDPQSVQAEDGETILAALLRCGVGFAYSCEAGNCGTCKCELVGGEVMELEYSEHALSPQERARGVVLACRTQIWGDTTIRRLSAEEFVMHPSRVMQCRAVEWGALTHDIWHLRLAIESGGPFTFSAGQFAKLTFEFAPEHPRDYSMANAPDDATLAFYIRSVPGGVSERLPRALKLGDRVKVSGPFGTSYWRPSHAGPTLLVAGGSGLAPIHSILLSMLNAGHTQPIHLYFGVRDERDIYGEAALRALAQRHSNLHMHVILSEASGPAGARRRGLVTQAISADFADLAGFQAYLAGPPVMVEAANDLLLALGMPARDIHADAFYATGESPRQVLA